MRLRGLLAAVAALIVGVGGLALASPASAVTTPVVVSPAPGGTLPLGSTGPLVIDFPSTGDYWVTVKCGTYNYYWSSGAFAPYHDRQSIVIDPVESSAVDLSGTTCQIEVDAPGSIAGTTSTFTVVGTPLMLDNVRASQSTFYPLVKDGYRDEVEFPFDVNRFTKGSLTIEDAKGKTVYSEHETEYYAPGEYWWVWGGTTTSGKPVLPGEYNATISVTTNDGSTATSSIKVRVDTKMATRRWKMSKNGWMGGTETTRGKCATDIVADPEGGSDYSRILNCQGGEFAASTYNFKIPANATNIRWDVSTSHTEDDFASRGSITKRGDRVGATKYQVRVQVTGYRAIIVNSVNLSYKARVRI